MQLLRSLMLRYQMAQNPHLHSRKFRPFAIFRLASASLATLPDNFYISQNA